MFRPRSELDAFSEACTPADREWYIQRFCAWRLKVDLPTPTLTRTLCQVIGAGMLCLVRLWVEPAGLDAVLGNALLIG